MQPKRIRMRGSCNATHNKFYSNTRETKIPKRLALQNLNTLYHKRSRSQL